MRTLASWTANLLLQTLIGSLALPVMADDKLESSQPFVAVLGVAQDGGFPQAGCRKQCCEAVWQDKHRSRPVACLAIVDPQHRQRWLIDCTPDFRQQLHLLDQLLPSEKSPASTGSY